MTATLRLLYRNHDHCRSVAYAHERAGNFAEALIWHDRMLDFAHEIAAEERQVVPPIPDRPVLTLVASR